MKSLLKPFIALLLAVFAVTLGGCGKEQASVSIGLITKQETNPYWIEMRRVAQETADRVGATLTTATGTSDVDVESQRAALQEMVSSGVDGILIAPTDSTALADDIAAARAAGVTVIAVDTPMDPLETTDAYYGTDNTKAGELVGAYAKAKATELGLTPEVLMLNLAPGIASGEERALGFRIGFELDQQPTTEVDSQGDQSLAEELTKAALETNPGINVVYAVNEPAALGAVAALKAAGKDLDQVVVVAVDGGCEAMKNGVRTGDIDATAMQFPQNMAREGVKSLVAKVREGQDPSGYLATGTELVAHTAAPGVESKNVEYGVRTCWGG